MLICDAISQEVTAEGKAIEGSYVEVGEEDIYGQGINVVEIICVLGVFAKWFLDVGNSFLGIVMFFVFSLFANVFHVQRSGRVRGQEGFLNETYLAPVCCVFFVLCSVFCVQLLFVIQFSVSFGVKKSLLNPPIPSI